MTLLLPSTPPSSNAAWSLLHQNPKYILKTLKYCGARKLESAQLHSYAGLRQAMWSAIITFDVGTNCVEISESTPGTMSNNTPKCVLCKEGMKAGYAATQTGYPDQLKDLKTKDE